MKIAMMQPSFLPWQGYFELISRADRFIFLDDFQFSVQSYHQRNRLFNEKEQVGWYSVPVRKSVSFEAPLNRTLINDKGPWRMKMWKRFRQNYLKADYYEQLAPHIEAWLFAEYGSLADMNMAFIKKVCSLLEFNNEWILSSEFNLNSRRSERVMELLKLNHATRYYCARGSFNYMLEDGIFPLNDIEILFQDFHPGVYPQIGSKNVFIPNLSVLDGLLNVGLERTAYLIRNGTKRWCSWQEMAGLQARRTDLHVE